MNRRAALLYLLVSIGCAEAAPDTPPLQAQESMANGAIASNSFYQLPVHLTTSRGEALELSSLRGRPLLVTMFYSRCTSVCPLLTMTVQRLEGALSAAERSNLRVLMVSFDATHDTPAALAAFADEHHIDLVRWVVARPSSADVRTFAAALGIRYRKLPDGTFNHSTVISLLDPAGVLVASSTTVTGLDEEFRDAVRRSVNAAAERGQ